eukprot:TRINITY_DN1987_c0_g1_i1.p1 TRINITY_DN1987_c0_g1~~TRINITY_DN1987_c0_g1_i1.p1  ORF type:complete len:734 (-),score=121.85 TRINITY_DN1987_c0_g1_i1:146-2275(-)
MSDNASSSSTETAQVNQLERVKGLLNLLQGKILGLEQRKEKFSTLSESELNQLSQLLTDALPNDHENLPPLFQKLNLTDEPRLASIKKKFCGKGVVNQDKHFFVCPSEQKTYGIMNDIKEGHNIFLQGPPKSGKSTLMNYIAQKDSSRCYLRAILSNLGLKFDSLENFQQSLESLVLEPLPLGHSSVQGQVSIQFRKIQSELFKKQVVLVIDDCDLILNNNDIIDYFRSRLIESKNMNTKVQSVVIVGFSEELHSVFQGEKIEMPYFCTNDRKSLFFDQYKRQHQFDFDSRIPFDIGTRTANHPGMVSLCGKILHELLLQSTSLEDFKVWKQFAKKELPKRILQTPLYYFIKEAIKDNDLQHFLVSNFGFDWSAEVIIQPEERGIANRLVALGVLSLDRGKYRVISPLMESMLKKITLPRLARKHELPLANGEFDVLLFLQKGLPLLSSQHFLQARKYSWKQNLASGVDELKNEQVPNEGAYQKELFALLKNWLPHGLFLVLPEIYSQGNRCDLFVKNRKNDYTVLLEIIAHAANTGDSGLTGHFLKTAYYKSDLKAGEAWVINFTTQREGFWWPGEQKPSRRRSVGDNSGPTREEKPAITKTKPSKEAETSEPSSNKSEGEVTPKKEGPKPGRPPTERKVLTEEDRLNLEKKVRCVHVSHDLEWTKAKLHYRDENKEEQSIDIELSGKVEDYLHKISRRYSQSGHIFQ